MEPSQVIQDSPPSTSLLVNKHICNFVLPLNVARLQGNVACSQASWVRGCGKGR